jgi:hypothetical protein
MFKSTKTKIITLALVGVVALGGAIYATSALAVGGASAAPATALTAQTTTDSQPRASILDMLKDRMGLTGANAETFADQMIARVQTVNPNFDLQDMVNWCSQFIGDNPSNPSGTTPGDSGSGVTPRGMMGGNGSTYGGWGMMGSAGLR